MAKEHMRPFRTADGGVVYHGIHEDRLGFSLSVQDSTGEQVRVEMTLEEAQTLVHLMQAAVASL